MMNYDFTMKMVTKKKIYLTRWLSIYKVAVDKGDDVAQAQDQTE